MTLPHPAEQPSAAADRLALEAGRERAIQVLTDRFADDTLSVDEFELRLDRMYQARSAAELDEVTRDLVAAPTGQMPAARLPQRSAASPPPQYPVPGETPALRRMLALMSETKYTGRWVVPRRLDVRAVMGDVLLDLRDASLPPGYCEIDVLAVMANLKVLVPPGVVVEGLVTSVMAAVGNDAEDDGRIAAAVRVRLTGVAFMSEVRVRVAPPGEPARQAWRNARHRGGW